MFIYIAVAPTDTLEFGSHRFKASSKPILLPCKWNSVLNCCCEKNEGSVHNNVGRRNVRIVQHYSFDTFCCCCEISLGLDIDFHQTSMSARKEEWKSTASHAASQQSLRTTSQVALEGSTAHPEWLGGRRAADGISLCTSQQGEIIQGIWHRSLQKATSSPQPVTQLPV